MKPQIPVGIIGYGAYVPCWRVENKAISEAWGKPNRLGVLKQKSFPSDDEDTVTIAIECGLNALQRSGIAAEELSAVWVGTESKPYAVKPSSVIVADAIGATPNVSAADFEFACKAGTEAMQTAIGFIGSGMARYAMAIGADTAQSRPGDELEYTASAGGAAFIMGPADEALATLEASTSFVSDTPDFFRRAHMHYPEHAYRFTGKPAYFHHSLNAAKQLMEETGTNPKDFDYCVFHQPTPKFPRMAAQQLGFQPEQYEVSMVVDYIGNTYSAGSMLGMNAVLDSAKAGDRVLMVSYGSGAGSDAFVWTITDKLEERRAKARLLKHYLERAKPVPHYGTYLKHYRKIVMQ